MQNAQYLDTCKSTSGYIFAAADGVVTWGAKLQKLIALTTTKAEYISAIEASK